MPISQTPAPRSHRHSRASSTGQQYPCARRRNPLVCWPFCRPKEVEERKKEPRKFPTGAEWTRRTNAPTENRRRKNENRHDGDICLIEEKKEEILDAVGRRGLNNISHAFRCRRYSRGPNCFSSVAMSRGSSIVVFSLRLFISPSYNHSSWLL